MGMAASQARLLMLTARIHDVEYQAQQIQSAKLQLATQEDAVYKKYNEALDATTLTFRDDKGTLVPANFNNLCGLASVTNGLNKNFVFRTGDDDRLIVPSDIYEGYKNFSGNGPYEFAMHMMGIEPEELTEAEDQFIKDRLEGSSDGDPLYDLQCEMEKKLEAILEKKDSSEEGYNKEDHSDFIKDIMGGVSVYDLLPKEDDKNYSAIKKLADEYTELAKEFKFKLYQKGGAEAIFCNIEGNEKADFDQDLFNYYMRWGMLIEQEVDIDYCIPENDYSANFGNDSETLNQMLQSGRITVDVVEIDKNNGKLTDRTTSVPSDNSLDYTNTTEIDKKALAKAEAEYEHDMKKIDKKDKQYDMELNKLETERTALTTEYDSVKKIIQDNIERTFGIFS